MRTLRPSVVRMITALAAAGLAVPAGAQSRDPYTSTLYHGVGLISIPVAWVAPRNADLRLQASGKTIPWAIDKSAHNFASYVNTSLSGETHWMGRFTVGASYYSQNPDYGLFGQVAILRDGDAGGLPGLAIGVRNIGNCKSQDRFFAGCDVQLNEDGEYERVTGDFYKEFSTRGSLYGVLTKDFATRPLIGALPGSAGLTLGYGSGVFSDDGGQGDAYNSKGTIAKGLFLGGRIVAHPSLNTTLTFLAENDGWDWNAGLQGDWRGISLGVYGTELEQSGTRDPRTLIYNYRKLNVSLGYSGNIIDISRGVLLRTRITALAREEQRLRYEIANRERRIRVLEVALRRAQAGELAEIEKRRRELEAEVSAEREAIRQANERLRQIEQGQRQPPPTPTPRPPQSSPQAQTPSQPPQR
jgi:hypothetical protein